jgi:UDP-N-acetylglucosamine 4,6-dehydratase/5-epimerase
LNLTGSKSILITGGTGSFGKSFARFALSKPTVERVIVFSRDELKQYEMAQEPAYQDARVRFFIGDVRDRDRLLRAMEGVDTVVHAAALKQVPAAEYNPFEAVKTNVLGAQNVIDAAIDRGVKRVVALSTDKAAAPSNLYGATKLCSDKLFVAANNFRGRHEIRFGVVRYGNVLGSRGSVIPHFLREAKTGVLPITDVRMTRFNITLDEGVAMVARALETMRGGEIFVPRIPSYRILDVAAAIGPRCEHRVVGIRPGEKLHEEMITSTDAPSTIAFDDHYLLLPNNPDWDPQKVATELGGRRVADAFSYSSATNDRWLTVAELRELVKKHVDPTFSWS